MKNLLTNNIGLKLLSVVVAFALWLIVINYDDPVVSATFSGIKVEIINASELTDKGQVYEVINNSDVVTVRVEAKRSVLDTIQEGNIHAVADMRDITARHTIAIQVYTNKNNDQLDNIYASRKDLELSVEDLKTIHLPINVYTSGDPAEGFIVGGISQTQNTVRVSGPESVIERISRAECYVSVADRYSDVSASADIRLVDENGVRVEHENLSKNISAINVTVSIYGTKAVPVIYNYSGEPAEGYEVTGEVTADREWVTLAGPQNSLDAVQQIVIPATEIDISSATGNVVRQVDILEHIPWDLMLVQGDDESFDGKVMVIVPIEQMVERTFRIPIANIRPTGVPEGMNAEILLDTNAVGMPEGDGEEEIALQIRTQGIQENYGELSGTAIMGHVDIAEYMDAVGVDTLGPGVYHIEIKLELPDGIRQMEKYHAAVRLTMEGTDDQL